MEREPSTFPKLQDQDKRHATPKAPASRFINHSVVMRWSPPFSKTNGSGKTRENIGGATRAENGTANASSRSVRMDGGDWTLWRKVGGKEDGSWWEKWERGEYKNLQEPQGRKGENYKYLQEHNISIFKSKYNCLQEQEMGQYKYLQGRNTSVFKGRKRFGFDPKYGDKVRLNNALISGMPIQGVLGRC